MLLDGSRSIEKANFERELDFSKDIVDAFRISEGRIRVSLIVYSTEPSVIFGLDKYHEKSQIFKAIDGINFPAAGSDLGKALKLVESRSFNFSTPSTSRVLVVLTDGRAKDEIETPAKDLAGKGVHILMTGVGNNLDIDQLETVASNPKEDSIFDLDKLPKLVERISRDVCEGIGNYLYVSL